MSVFPRLAAAGALMLLVLAGAPARAFHRETPSATRLTSGFSPHTHSAARSWGTYYAFTAAASPFLASSQSGGSKQIYVFSLLDYDCQEGRPDLQNLPWEVHPSCPTKPRPFVIPVTSGAGDPDNPSVDETGTVVAFDALGSLGSSTGPAASRRQIFIKNVGTGQLTQVTDSPDGDSIRPSLNQYGTVLVFESDASVLGTAGVSQVYRYQISTGTIQQLTFGKGPSTRPMSEQVGKFIVYQSTASLLGDGSNTGVSQIFLYSNDDGTTAQLTHGSAPSRHPYISEKFPHVVFFDSSAPDLLGTNGGPGTQIYGINPFAGTSTQYTFGPGNCSWPAVDPGGKRVAFICDGDVLANGTRGNRLFVFDFGDPSQTLFQLTGRGDVQGPLGFSLNNWIVTLSTTDDLDGRGSCGYQLYVSDYLLDHYAEPGHGRLAATRLGQVPGEPPIGDANAGCSDGDPCTADVCAGAGAGGFCTHTVQPDGTTCGEGNQCVGFQTCRSGACVQGSGLNCDDQDQCTTDTCDPTAGCQHTTAPDFEGLMCRKDVPSPSEPSAARLLDRAKKSIDRAANAPKKSQALRLLNRAARLLNRFLRIIAAIPGLDPQVELKAHDLLNQIACVIEQLSGRGGTCTGGGS